MSEGFFNVYDDRARAAAYSQLEFPGTYYLAFRDLPAILGAHVQGRQAVDFGCGTGRSTRFLRELGFDVVGVDVSEEMLAQARGRDPQGDYRLVPDGGAGDSGGAGGLAAHGYDLVLAAFTFDNVPTQEKKVALFRSLRLLLKDHGKIVNLVSTPDIYVNEWASFSTRAYPENRNARSGDKVLIEMLDVEDRRPVEDILWTDADYQTVYEHAGLKPLQASRPLGKQSEAFPWVSETTIAPWAIYVLGAAEPGKRGNVLGA